MDAPPATNSKTLGSVVTLRSRFPGACFEAEGLGEVIATCGIKRRTAHIKVRNKPGVTLKCMTLLIRNSQKSQVEKQMELFKKRPSLMELHKAIFLILCIKC